MRSADPRGFRDPAATVAPRLGLGSISKATLVVPFTTLEPRPTATYTWTVNGVSHKPTTSTAPLVVAPVHGGLTLSVSLTETYAHVTSPRASEVFVLATASEVKGTTTVHVLVGSDLQLSSLDLADFSLQGANLSGSDLAGAVLTGGQATGDNFAGADLAGAHLQRTAFRSSNLYRANLAGADLVGSSLSSAKCNGTNFTNANLRGATAVGATFIGTVFRARTSAWRSSRTRR